MATLLLIGGSGFFGKSFLDSFQRGQLEKWEINKIIVLSRNADRLKYECPEILGSHIELINADIGTLKQLPYADYVIHAAASTDVRNYVNSPLIEKQNILSAAYNYCNVAPKFHRKSKILFVSSGAVYGSQPADLYNFEETFEIESINSLPDGKRDYALAKIDSEIFFKALANIGLNVSIARCFAFVGQWLPRDQHFAIGNFLNDIINKRPVEVKADHPVYRSYMHSDDLVHWLLTITHAANVKCEIYNVGSENAVSLNELAHLIAKIGDVDVLEKPHTEGKVERYVPSTAKARSLLNLCETEDLRKVLMSIYMRNKIELGK